MTKRELVKTLEEKARAVQQDPTAKDQKIEEATALLLDYIGSSQIRQAYLRIVCAA